MSEQKNNQQAAPEQDLNQQRKVRREELAALQLSPHGLTQAQALRLVRDALARARRSRG